MVEKVPGDCAAAYSILGHKVGWLTCRIRKHLQLNNSRNLKLYFDVPRASFTVEMAALKLGRECSKWAGLV